MAITHKEIAALAGVSRGTVDRALHNRGRVSPEVKRRILEVAEAHGYTPNRAGRALAMAKKPVKIGVVVHLSRLPFFRRVIAGIEQARLELAALGGEVLVEQLPGLDAAAQLQAVESLLERGIQGLAISPVEDGAVHARLAELTVPVVTFNTDMEPSRRLCFVGLDNARAGSTAAGLMALMLGCQGSQSRPGGEVLIISGSATNQANARRVEGFVSEIGEHYPAIRVPGIRFSGDDGDAAHQIVRSTLLSDPGISGIYMVSGGQAGACRALEEAERTDIRLVVHDILPETVAGIRRGVVDFIIDQNAFVQGARPPRLLFDYLMDGRAPEAATLYTDISIRTRQNL